MNVYQNFGFNPLATSGNLLAWVSCSMYYYEIDGFEETVTIQIFLEIVFSQCAVY